MYLLRSYQLIYAVGAHTELPSQQARARACQALLHVLSREAHGSGPIGNLLARQGVAVPSGPGGKPGAYRGVRLLPGEALERAAPELRQLLAEAVLAQPPHAMRWMAGHPQQVGVWGLSRHHPSIHCCAQRSSNAALPCPAAPPLPQELQLRCINDTALDASAALDALPGSLSEGERADVLALRGLLACGVLQHCLQMRHLVDYGVNE